jgi:two-component system invasion response regulator UvrY
MIRILIVDDHPIVRKGLKLILAECPDLVVTGEAESAAKALSLIESEPFDAMVLDIAMPDRSGLDLLEHLRKRSTTPVLVLSIYPEEQYAVQVFKAGASGYLNKESAPEELVQALRKIAAGGKYISKSFAEKVANSLVIGFERLPHETLSRREYQVLYLLGKGLSNQEIAAQLFLSPKTVSVYRTRILAKMKMKTNAELIRYTIQHSLVEG